MKKEQQNSIPPIYTNELIGALADAFGNHPDTIRRWVRLNDDRLTSERARRVYENFKATPIAESNTPSHA